jgi:hypothetical protein
MPVAQSPTLIGHPAKNDRQIEGCRFLDLQGLWGWFELTTAFRPIDRSHPAFGFKKSKVRFG